MKRHDTILPAAPRQQLWRRILAIALPAVVTNIVTPLLSITDVTIAGHMSGASTIAAIAVGANMFNLLYWLFGFLRMGSSGMTAQAYGRGNRKEQAAVLWRSLCLSTTIGAAMILLSQPLCHMLLSAMDVSGDTATMASSYFHILIWGAPAYLGGFAVTGWLLGMQDSRTSMWVSGGMVALNICLSLTFVFALRMGIEGLATGTLAAQWAGFAASIIAAIRIHNPAACSPSEVMHADAIGAYFKVNTDIFLRTLCLVAVTLWFTRVGAMQGPMMIAVNALLIQLFTFFSFFMDGFAFAGEALCGRYTGERNGVMFRATVRSLMIISALLAVIFSVAYFLAGSFILRLLTDDISVIRAATDYMPWAVTVPLLGFMAFAADGIFIGATATRRMLVSMAIATAAFFAVYFAAWPSMHNHALWLAFGIYLLMRGLVLIVMLPRITPVLKNSSNNVK